MSAKVSFDKKEQYSKRNSLLIHGFPENRKKNEKKNFQNIKKSKEKVVNIIESQTKIRVEALMFN